MSKRNHKHNFLTIKDKLNILEQVNNGVPMQVIANRFGIVKSTVSKIKSSETKLRNFVEKSNSVNKRKTVRSSEYPVMEKLLYDWIVRQRLNNVAISSDVLQEKAIYYHRKYESGQFNASKGWLTRFRRRRGLWFLKVCGEKLSSNHSAVDPFVESLNVKISEMNLSKSQVYNADESGLFWKSMPSKTIVTSTEKNAPGRKKFKHRITFMPCANATGDHEIRMLVIGRSKQPRALKNFANPIEYRANSSSWMTRELFV